MAWIELHQGLAQHHKMRRVKRSLGVGVAQVIGHMALLWTWAIDAAPDGDLTDFGSVDIAEQAEWGGDPLEFVGALVSAGLLDQDGERLTIHDWMQYAGRLLEKRRADTERKRMSRGRPSDIQRTAHVTVPNRTVPNHVHVGSPAAADDVCVFDDPAPELPGGQDDREPDQEGDTLEAKSEALVMVPAGRSLSPAPKPRDTYPAEFEVFWKPYPRKVVKDAAAESYKRARSRGATAEEIQAGLVRWLGSVDWKDQELKHLPHASTWLNQRRWRDEPEQAVKSAVVQLQADGRPDDLAWERSFVKTYDTDAERIEALVDRARAVQRVILDKAEALGVLDACGLDGEMRWVRDAVRLGVAARAGVSHG